MPDRRLDITLIAFLANSPESGEKNVWEWDGWSDITANQENPFTAEKRDEVMRTQKPPPFFDTIDNYTEAYSGMILLLRQNHQQVDKLLKNRNAPSFTALRSWAKKASAE